MEGAVHRLDLVDLFLNIHLVEHALRVEFEVTRLLPQLHVCNVRAVNKLVAAPHVQILPKALDDVPHSPSLGMPEDKSSSCLLLDAEQIHLLPKLAVIPAFGLFYHVLVRLELIFVLPCSPVDALQRSLRLVSAPVSARHSLQLESLATDISSRLHVGSSTQVPPLLADVVDADVLALGDGVEELELVRLLLRFDALPCLLSRHNFAPDRELLVDDLLHLLLNCLEVFLLKAPSLQIKVVEEPILDPRADRHLRLGEQTLDRHGHDVSGGMTNFDKTR
mmetsp:Transcript_41360/g.130156  ORF Transcript_41360/g.130156 Transcript_41360/m.130156 type:complete len:278 (+) Transcript_41360:2193-3026(+)